MLLKGKKILITGVANDWSMAWAIAKRAAEMGAEIAMPYAMPALEKRVRPLAESIGAKFVTECNVQNDEQLDALFNAIEQEWGHLDGMLHAIAFSEGFDDVHEVTEAYLEKMIEMLIDKKLSYNQIWDVNFPSSKLSDFKGILENRTIAHNSFYNDEYIEEVLSDGTRRLHVKGHYQEDAISGTDFRAIVDGYISVGVVNNLQ